LHENARALFVSPNSVGTVSPTSVGLFSFPLAKLFIDNR